MEINIKGLLNNVNQMYISNFLWQQYPYDFRIGM